jgi:23S rRNA pseudouridine2604 synthase
MTDPRKSTLKLPSKSAAKEDEGAARKLSPRAARAQAVRGAKPLAPTPAAKVTAKAKPAATPAEKPAPRPPARPPRDARAEGDAARPPRPGPRAPAQGQARPAPRGQQRDEQRGDHKFAPRGERKSEPKGEGKFTPRGERKVEPRGEGKVAPRGDRNGERSFAPRADRKIEPRSGRRADAKTEQAAERKPPRPRLAPAQVTRPEPESDVVRIAPLPFRTSNSAEPTETMRLSKRMSELGLASRREADEWIERGWVRVDGEVATLGEKWLPGQEISIDKRARKEQDRRLTVLLHKPVGYVSGQAEDGYEPASVLVVPESQWTPPAARSRMEGRLGRKDLLGLAPAGRLDIDSTGLLVLTQDGRIAKQLIGEDSDVEKEYLVRVNYTKGGKLPESELRLLQYGLSLDGKKLKPARVTWQNDDQLRFILKEGKKRQIRRMCEAVGLEVLALKRVRIGQVRLGELPVGQWRLLGPEESFE